MKITFLEILFVVFLVLKLCNVVSWSWWIVTAPLWGSLAIFLLIVAVGILGAVNNWW